MSKSMEEARAFCRERHGDLVSFTSKEENIFLWKQVGIVSLAQNLNCAQGLFIDIVCYFFFYRYQEAMAHGI